MKCGKCGTPIIPGEDFCRICGTKSTNDVEDMNQTNNGSNYQSNDIQEINPNEINIDNIEALAGISDVSDNVKEVETLEMPSIDSNGNMDVYSVSNENTISQNTETQNETLTISNDAVTDSTKTGGESDPNLGVSSKDLEILETVSVPNIEETVNENKPNEVVEDLNEVKEEEPTVLDVSKDEKDIEEIIAKNKKKPNLAFWLTFLLLLVSLGANVYLYLNKEEKETPIDENPIIEVTEKKIYYEGYSLEIPLDWFYINRDKNIILSDRNENWGASIQVVAANFESFAQNKDNFNEILKNYSLEMTSKIEKVIDNKTLYVFGGKYNDYITDIVVSESSDGNIVVAKVLYKGEKNNVVLNKVFDLVTTVSKFETNILNDTNFTFEDLTNAISETNASKTES